MDPRRWQTTGAAATTSADLAPPSPGKVTLTQRLARSTRPPVPPTGSTAVQAAGGAVMPLEPFALHEVAAAGVADATSTVPHLAALQASFGHHDLSAVRAQVGGPAAGAADAIGARAYAYGDAVAFAASPDLRQAAHEAAHVVQQRGGVRLDGGVGRAGDPYEQHADAVADAVVRGQSAEALLDTLAHRGAAGGPAVQREANAVGIGADWRDDPEDRAALAARLSDVLGHPVAPDGVEAAIAEFQTTHDGEIDEVVSHSDAMAHGYDGPVTPFPEARPVDPGRSASDEARATYRTELRAWSRRRATWLRARRPTTADDGTREDAGDLHPDDATHIALANAWPRRFFGALLRTAEDGYDYLKSQVIARGLPFNDQRVNIVGIRGMQGGTLHGDVGVGLASSTFDDTFFVMCLDEHGAKMIREFRGTTEPGGRSSEFRRDHPDEYGPTERSAAVRDHDVETMEADQQVVYHFTTTDTSKLGRPTLTPRVETADGDPLVVAPHRTGAATTTEDDATHDGDADALAVPPVDGDPRLHDRLRTRRGREVLDRSLGIAIHSGGADDTVDAESTGCQVIQGDWYGDFIATIQRGLTAARLRAGERVRPGHPATEGDVLYSLLQASDLARDEASMRAAIAGVRAPRQEGAAAVAGDGGVTGDPTVVHAHAAAGLTGAATDLPHAEAIAASFGHHDVAGIRAHVGGPAARAADAIGARAYAYGDAVAFAAPPDLRQAAHEAAHVVQQRGGVRLDGGVGRAGDPYEQHADAVADAVVRGQSAEALLDTLAHRGAAGGPAVQRLDFDGDGQDDGEARTPAALDALIALIVAAISENETGHREPRRSTMHTSSGVAASYASATQMIASHVVGTLDAHDGDTAAMAAERRAYGDAHGLDEDEVDEATRIANAAGAVWDLLVHDHQAVDVVPARLIRTTRFTADELARMARFGELRAAVEAGRARHRALAALGQAALARRIAEARRQLDELRGAGTAADAPAATSEPEAADAPADAAGAAEAPADAAGAAEAPAADDAPAAEGAAEAPAAAADAPAADGAAEAPAADGAAAGPAADGAGEAPAADPALGERVLDAIWHAREVTATRPLLRPWTPPRRLTPAVIRSRTREIDRAEASGPTAVGFGAGAVLAAELFAEPTFAALARELGIARDDVRVYIFSGTFDRFNEDRASWARIALSRYTERHGDRTYDEALASAAEDGHGRAMSRLEFDLFVRGYVLEHPRARDREVVRAAASHNGGADGYDDNILERFDRLRAAAAPTTAEPAATAPTAPAADPAR